MILLLNKIKIKLKINKKIKTIKKYNKIKMKLILFTHYRLIERKIKKEVKLHKFQIIILNNNNYKMKKLNTAHLMYKTTHNN